MAASPVGAATRRRQPVGADGGAPPSFAFRGGLLLDGAHLYLIYWGSAWVATSAPSSGNVTAAVSALLDSDYTTALGQYGAAAPPTVTGDLVAASSDPPAEFNDSDVVALIFDLIEAGTIPEPASDPYLLYVVFLPPGVRSVRGDIVGEHSYFTYLDLTNAPAGPGFPPANAHYGWVSNDGSLDSITTVFSHELVESITDPEGDGITGDPGTCSADGWCEIGDVCSRTEVVGGVRVQSYWSQEAGACVVGGSAAPPAGQEPASAPQPDGHQEAKPSATGDGPPPSGSGADRAAATIGPTPRVDEAPTSETVTRLTVISTPALPSTAEDTGRTQRWPAWWRQFTGALVVAAPVISMVAVFATVIAYLLPIKRVGGMSPPSSVLLIALLVTLVLWLILGEIGRPLATAKFANVEEHSQLVIRVEELRARLAGGQSVPPAAPDDARAVARNEAVQLLKHLDDKLGSDGLAWVQGMAYIQTWMALHRAEEALLLLMSLESVIGEGLYDELRLEGSQIANLDELLSKVRRAVSTLSAQAAHLYLGKEDLASAVEKPAPEKADPEQMARATLRTVRLTLNQYRDELWSGIVRARNKLLKTHFIAALCTYLLLVLLVLRAVDRRIVLAASVFFLFGGLVGFVGRLRDEATTDKGLEDFGLGTARLITAPLLSGLAASLGVLLVGLAHLKIGDFALGPGPAPGSSFPALSDIFSLAANPAGFLAAAIFGLTPALLIGYLQSETAKLNQAIKSSEASGQSTS